jgi:hypothetical protein
MRLYGLTSDNHRLLHRVSFSPNVLRHIGSRFLEKPYQILRLDYTLGLRLAFGARSATGAYAICSGRTGKILRVTLLSELAWGFLADEVDRFVAEIAITPYGVHCAQASPPETEKD